MNQDQQDIHPKHPGDEPEKELEHFSNHSQEPDEDLEGDSSEDLFGAPVRREIPYLPENDPLATKIYNHSIFTHKNDEIISPLLQVINSLKVTNPDLNELALAVPKVSTAIFEKVFEGKTVEELKTEFETLGLSKKTTCGELIQAGDLCWRCLDCEKEVPGGEILSVFCTPCFDKSNHKGHRLITYKMTASQTGFCDCGDSEMVNPEGFCPNHKLSDIFSDDILRKFPRNIVKNCKEALGKAFYGVVTIFEMIKQLEGQRKAREELLIYSEIYREEIYKFIQTCYSEISISFIPLFTSIFQSSYQAPFNQFKHVCESFSAKEIYNLESRKSDLSDCKCTIIGTLLRNVNIMEEDEQTTIKKILLECLKVPSFKEFFVTEFKRYTQFMFPSAFSDKVYKNTAQTLFALYMPIANKEELVLRAVEGKVFMNYLTVMREIFITYKNLDYNVLSNLGDVQVVLMYFITPNYKNAIKKLLMETTYLLELFDIIVMYKNMHYKASIGMGVLPHFIPIESINTEFIIGRNLTISFERCLQAISQFPKQEKIAILTKVFHEWLVKDSQIRDADTKRVQSEGVNFNPIYERMVNEIIRSYQPNFVLQDIQEFLNVVYPTKTTSDFADRIMINILKALGYERFIHVIHNQRMEDMRVGYYRFPELLFEADIVSIQMMIMIHKPENLFETLTQNFFSYEVTVVKFIQNNVPLEKNEKIK